MVNYYLRYNFYVYDYNVQGGWHKQSRKLDFIVETVIKIPDNCSEKRKQRIFEEQIIEMDAKVHEQINRIDYGFVYNLRKDEQKSGFQKEKTTNKETTYMTLNGKAQTYTFRAINVSTNKEFKNYEI